MMAAFSWNSLDRLPTALLLFAAGAVLTLWLYLPVIQIPGPWRRCTLSALRLAALGALSLSLLEPGVVRPKTTAERGAIVLLVDDSKSMSVSDAGRTPAQLVALASALGRLPVGARDQTIASLQADADRLVWQTEAADRARNELDYAKLAGRGLDAAGARLDQALQDVQATAQSAMQKAARLPASDPSSTVLRQTLDELAHPPQAPQQRGDWLGSLRNHVKTAGAEIERQRLNADEDLFDRNPQVHDVCTELSDEPRLNLAILAAITGPGSLVKQLPAEIPVLGFGFARRMSPFFPRAIAEHPEIQTLAANGDASDLGAAATAVSDHLHGQPVRAIVLISDGRQVGGDAAVSSGLSASGVPIYTVCVAPPGALRDVSVLSLTASQQAFVGETITVSAAVRAVGLPGAAVDVKFQIGDQPPQTRHVTFVNEQPLTLRFAHHLTTPGPQRLTLDVSPLTGETTLENNHAQRWENVSDRRMKVAVYSGAPAGDFQNVCDALAATPWVELSSGVLADNATHFPLSPEEILQNDVIVLFDVPAAALDGAQWSALTRLPRQHGKSVILVAGNAHLPAEYSTHSATANLLPFDDSSPPRWRAWPGDLPAVRLLPAPAELDTAALRFWDDSEPAENHWRQLPAMSRFLPVSPSKPNVKPLLLEAESGLPVLTEIRLGKGRVLFFGAGETWRWRDKSNGADQDRFWRRLIRYAAEAPMETTSTPATAMDAEMADLTPDETILRRLSRSSGGQFLRLDQIDALPRKLIDMKDPSPQLVERRLWDSPYLYALVVGCLSVEWSLRKRMGLA